MLTEYQQYSHINEPLFNSPASSKGRSHRYQGNMDTTDSSLGDNVLFSKMRARSLQSLNSLDSMNTSYPNTQDTTRSSLQSSTCSSVPSSVPTGSEPELYELPLDVPRGKRVSILEGCSKDVNYNTVKMPSYHLGGNGLIPIAKEDTRVPHDMEVENPAECYDLDMEYSSPNMNLVEKTLCSTRHDTSNENSKTLVGLQDTIRIATPDRQGVGQEYSPVGKTPPSGEERPQVYGGSGNDTKRPVRKVMISPDLSNRKMTPEGSDHKLSPRNLVKLGPKCASDCECAKSPKMKKSRKSQSCMDLLKDKSDAENGNSVAWTIESDGEQGGRNKEAYVDKLREVSAMETSFLEHQQMKNGYVKQLPKHKKCTEHELHQAFGEPCMFHIEDSISLMDTSRNSDRMVGACSSGSESENSKKSSKKSTVVSSAKKQQESEYNQSQSSATSDSSPYISSLEATRASIPDLFSVSSLVVSPRSSLCSSSPCVSDVESDTISDRIKNNPEKFCSTPCDSFENRSSLTGSSDNLDTSVPMLLSIVSRDSNGIPDLEIPEPPGFHHGGPKESTPKDYSDHGGPKESTPKNSQTPSKFSTPLDEDSTLTNVTGIRDSGHRFPTVVSAIKIVPESFGESIAEPTTAVDSMVNGYTSDEASYRPHINYVENSVPSPKKVAVESMVDGYTSSESSFHPHINYVAYPSMVSRHGMSQSQTLYPAQNSMQLSRNVTRSQVVYPTMNGGFSTYLDSESCTSCTSVESLGLEVPVNSPNITTDSGSSKPGTTSTGTDTYDYIDVFKMKATPRRLKRKGPDGMPPPERPGPRKQLFPKSSSKSVTSAQSNHSNNTAHSNNSKASKEKVKVKTNNDQDSGVSTQSSTQSKHIQLSDSRTGATRTIVQHSAVARNLYHEKKKALKKKIKRFSNNFYRVNSSGTLQIQTLGHF